MSLAAEWIRKRMLSSQIDDAQQRARDLWWLIQTAYGFGGYPPPGTDTELWNTVSESERLMLELQVSL